MGSRRQALGYVMTALGLAGICALGVSGVAIGAHHKHHGIKVETRSATDKSNNIGVVATATPTCPKGTGALGGGFSESKPNNGLIGIVYENHKVGQDRWRVAEQQYGFGTVTLTAYVYCSPSARTTKQHTANFTPAANMLDEQVASCTPKPGRIVAQSGGWQTAKPIDGFEADDVVTDSSWGANNWEERVATEDSPGNYTLFADCAKGIFKKVDSKTVIVHPATNELIHATSTCPGATHPAMGGFTQGTDGTHASMFPYESRAVGRSWRASGLSVTPSSAVGLWTSEVLCR